MIIKIFTLIWLTASIPGQKRIQPSLDEVRRLYLLSAEDKGSCRCLMDMMEPYNEKNAPLFAGYKAAAGMVMAKHIFNPVVKLSLFRQGRAELKKAISADPGNIELRFLRYTIQMNCPSFLGYRDKLTEDKSYLLKYIEGSGNAPLGRIILAYMSKE